MKLLKFVMKLLGMKLKPSMRCSLSQLFSRLSMHLFFFLYLGSISSAIAIVHNDVVNLDIYIYSMLTGAFHKKNSPCNLLQLQSTYYPLPAKCKARP